MCAVNVTWRGQSVQCCTCSKWVHLKCSQLFFSKFRILGSSHCRTPLPPRTLPICIPPLYKLALSLLMLHFRPTLAHFISFTSAPSPRSLAPGCSSTLPASSPSTDSLRVLQWNAGGLRARSTELLHFLLSYSVDLICIQESNLNSSFSFRISGFSALRCDRTHSRSGILSRDAKHASGGVIIFVRRGLSFSELSTSSLSSLNPYSDCVGVNISLNYSSSLSFLNVYAALIRSFPTVDRIDSLFPSILLYFRNFFILGEFNCHHPLWDSKGTSDPHREEVFDWAISSDFLPLNDSDTLTLLHRSSGSRFFSLMLHPDGFFFYALPIL